MVTSGPASFGSPLTLCTITPNRAFFVRWHLTDIPEVSRATWRLRVGGAAAGTPAEYSLDDLKRGFETVELVAVCQCSGARRGLSDPHVPGVEWGYGAVGNARWRGVRQGERGARKAERAHEHCEGKRSRTRKSVRDRRVRAHAAEDRAQHENQRAIAGRKRRRPPGSGQQPDAHPEHEQADDARRNASALSS